MAAMPLVISPETTELRVGQALRLQLAPDPSAAGEIQWYFESAPLPGQTGPVCSIAAVQAHNQGVYRAIVQRGPFGGLEGNVPAGVDISEPAFVFIVPSAPLEPPSCAICLSPVQERDIFRFKRKTEESFHSGFRVLSSNGRSFSAELEYCSHEFHRACVTSYAEHAILSDRRWCVRCPSADGCEYRLYSSDLRELCGQSSPAHASYVELKKQDFSERVRQVQAGEEVDDATRQWMAENCDVCPGCKAIVFRDAGCTSLVCPCEARFVHGQHRLST